MNETAETYLNLLEQSYYEAKFVFEGLADEHVWKRPAEGVLSIGELAGHIAYAEALRFASEVRGYAEPDLAKCRVHSPLIDYRFRYSPYALETSPTEQQLAMTAEQVCNELIRVHEESVAHLRATNPSLESIAPGYPANFTYEEFLKYNIFHVAYHTGQMYTVRHLLGEETPDN